ncbi:hypothetical protein ACFS07_28350 [Undibacterium arcticum]
MEHFELNELKQHATNFNQAVAERDGQITNLNQAVAERDGQITNLNQAVAERDGQITNLNQAVAERGGQITNLNQSVTERDGQIVNLNHAVVEREGQIAILRDKADRIVIDKDSETRNAQQQLNQIIHSRSWRVTAPLRKVVAAIRQGAPSACMSLLGKK